MKENKLVLPFRIAVYICGLVAGILQLLSALIAFEKGTHYFLRGAVLPVFAWIVALLGVGFAIASACLEKSQLLPERSRFSFLFPVVGFAAIIPSMFALLDSSFKTTVRLAILTLILLIFAALFCLLSVIFKGKKVSGITALLGLAAILAPACLTLLYYFDKSVEMNSPFKVTLQIGLLFAMFPFVCEVRTRLERPLPRLLLGLRLAAFPMASLASCLLLPAFFSGSFAKSDYFFGGLFLCLLQLSLLFDLFAPRKDTHI